TARITGERGSAGGEAGRQRTPTPRRADEGIPPEYRSGIGVEGVKALTAFVEKGGTLVTLGGAGSFAIEKLELSLRNVVAGRNSREFWCPGSTLKVKSDITNPLAYGMPTDGLAVYMSGSPVFEITPSAHNEEYEVIVRYADKDILQSGWLIGEQTLAKKAAMVAAKYKEGRVILIGFRAQHRAQTHGTYKLLFNALVR
ncbi:MAG: BPL-N domain-containing protein, partial [Acidobacteria bacterium]|nr:BPL-N domain-containing protein [Acidobacteriota bacterium]